MTHEQSFAAVLPTADVDRDPQWRPLVPDPEIDPAAPHRRSDASDEDAHAVPDRVTELSEQLRQTEMRLEAERARHAQMDWARIRQLRDIVASQEEERGRFARSLQEQVGQQLTALQLTMEALESAAGHETSMADQIHKCLEMIATVGQGLDSIASELRPAALDDLGLSAVLRNYLRQWSGHAGVRGTFHSTALESERFAPEVEATLYRVARGALERVAQARAHSVAVLLERRDTNAVVIVEDDGVASIGHRDGRGLGALRERVAALGGTIEVEPAPTGGTTLLARVPMTLPQFDPLAIGLPEFGLPDSPVSASETLAGEPPEGAVSVLRARLAELRTAIAARDEFVATVAHELRNPVAPLIFQIRLAIERTEQMVRANELVPPDWVQSQFLRVEQRLHRLLETLDRLLDVSRLSTGRVDLQPEPVNLVRAVREIVNSFEAELVVAQCSLTVDERCAPTGSWDPIRLEQICRNLLTNAIRFGAGSPIEVTIDGDTDFAILQVRDHGVGIAPDQQARMFERFERGSEQRSGGFGIGLWIVKNICAAMGGSISVESTLGEGASFTVMLPRHPDDAVDRAH